MGGNYSFPGFDLIGATAVLRVNQHGKRYSDEGFGTHVLAAVPGAKQPNGMLWGIFDSTIQEQVTYQAPCHAVFDYTNPKECAKLEKALEQARLEKGNSIQVRDKAGAVRPLYCADTLEELPEYRMQAAQFPQNITAQRRLLRSLMNVRPPMPLRKDFLTTQDELLSEERDEKGVVDGDSLPVTSAYPQIAVWQGDITRLEVDAIVDADNSALLGCFRPCHGCIDNAIHSAAGLQLRDECNQLMTAQGHPEPTGRAKLTSAYNLPAKYILHTVGPIVQSRVTRRDREKLAFCYRSCLELAAEQGLSSVAFCCISTGEFHFPNQEAAKIAVKTVTDFLQHSTSIRNGSAKNEKRCFYG